VREGAIEVQQSGAFMPLFLRKKPDDRPAIYAVPN